MICQLGLQTVVLILLVCKFFRLMDLEIAKVSKQVSIRLTCIVHLSRVQPECRVSNFHCCLKRVLSGSNRLTSSYRNYLYGDMFWSWDNADQLAAMCLTRASTTLYSSGPCSWIVANVSDDPSYAFLSHPPICSTQTMFAPVSVSFDVLGFQCADMISAIFHRLVERFHPCPNERKVM